MDTGAELLHRLNAWCKDHRYGVRNPQQWNSLSHGAAHDIYQELLTAGFTPLHDSQLQRIVTNTEQWWWKQNSRSPYGRARASHHKGNPLKPTALDDGIE
ncbi:hypothetical protein CQ018_13410 [Arthrobacter sp. MYb227]|nr:hypothetical protein CQ018_13410 [Arthrobacter sp. MYb227]